MIVHRDAVRCGRGCSKLGARSTLFNVKVFEALPNSLMSLGMGLIAIGLYVTVRAMAEIRR